MTDTKIICPGCDRKFNSVGTMTNHGRSIHWWSEKQIEAMKREHNMEHISMEKATGRPWGINLAHGVPTIFSQSKTGYPAICMMSSGAEKPNNEANAALIVRAVNSHEALIKALESAVGLIEDMQDNEGYPRVPNHIQEALRLAKGA